MPCFLSPVAQNFIDLERDIQRHAQQVNQRLVVAHEQLNDEVEHLRVQVELQQRAQREHDRQRRKERELQLQLEEVFRQQMEVEQQWEEVYEDNVHLREELGQLQEQEHNLCEHRSRLAVANETLEQQIELQGTYEEIEQRRNEVKAENAVLQSQLEALQAIGEDDVSCQHDCPVEREERYHVNHEPSCSYQASVSVRPKCYKRSYENIETNPITPTDSPLVKPFNPATRKLSNTDINMDIKTLYNNANEPQSLSLPFRQNSKENLKENVSTENSPPEYKNLPPTLRQNISADNWREQMEELKRLMAVTSAETIKPDKHEERARHEQRASLDVNLTLRAVYTPKKMPIKVMRQVGRIWRITYE